MFDKLRIGSDAKAAKDFTPNHPNAVIGKTHGISLSLHGKHSEQYRNATAALLRRAKRGTLTPDEAVEESAKLIVACCDGWVGVTDAENKEKKFNRKDLFEMLINDDFRWLRLQAEQFMQEDDNFF